MNVRCSIDTCKYNYGKKCRKTTIYLGWKFSNEFKCGERVTFPTCEDFEEEKMTEIENPSKTWKKEEL